MSEKIDMSLDDIIRREKTGINVRKGGGIQSRNRTFRRSFGGRFGGNNSRGFGGRNRESTRSQPYFRSQNNNKYQSPFTGRLLISNLAYSVSDEDLTELFASFGPLKKSCIHYDQFGCSLGTAEIIFEMKSDAITALNKYNGVPLDGRAMRIQLLGGKPQNERSNERQFAGNRGRGRASGRGSGPRTGNRDRNNVTLEDLDKELDSWKMEIE